MILHDFLYIHTYYMYSDFSMSTLNAGGPNLDRLKEECAEIKTLIPKRASQSSDDTGISPSVTPVDTPVHHNFVSDTLSLSTPASVNVEDLDFLPTKEEVGTDVGAGG